jgi:uncharacterized protein
MSDMGTIMAQDAPNPGEAKASEAARGLESFLATAATRGAGRKPAPVESWHPPFCGDIDMRIARDGTWFYNGSPIGRPALVKLFASILRRDPERYVLVTPVECVGIKVEDVPFIGVEMEETSAEHGPALRIRTNVDDEIAVGRDHALKFEKGEADGIVPYVLVRGDLWARLTRTLFFDLVGRGELEDVNGETMFGVRSGGRFFPMAPAKDIEVE